MKKNFTYVLLALIILFGIYLFIDLKRKSSLSASDKYRGQLVLKDFPVGEISKVKVTNTEGEVTLVKKNDNWGVKERKNYSADTRKIGELLQAIQELKVRQAVPAGESTYARLKLKSPTSEENGKKNADKENAKEQATLFQFWTNDKGKEKSKSENGGAIELYLGKEERSITETPDRFGVSETGSQNFFIRTNKMPEGFVWLVKDAFDNPTTKPEDWINKKFFSIGQLEKLSLEYADEKNANENWSVYCKIHGGDLFMDDMPPGKEIDPQQTSGFAMAFNAPNMADVLFNKKALGKNPVKFTAIDFDGWKYEIQVGDLKDEKYPMTIEVKGNLPEEWAKVEKDFRAKVEVKVKANKKIETEDKDKKIKELLEKEKNDYQKKRKELKEKLEFEKSLAGKVFLVNQWSVKHLIKKRSEILRDIQKDEENGGSGKATEG